MKKFLLLIPLLAFALMANAKVIEVQPGNNTIRYAMYASTTEDNDVLVLADGIYTDDNYIEFMKSVEVRAKEGATPIVQLYTYIKVAEGKDVTIKDVVFDGNGQGSYDYIIRQYNVHSLTLDGCEFRNMKNIVIYGPNGSHTGSLTVNNCYFHNNQKQAIYFEASTTEGTETCDELTVTNSTFANTTALTNWISIIDVRPYGSSMTDAIKVTIDHCTFYNNPTVDSGHADIRLYKLSDATVSNCIFAHPEAYERRATYNYGGTISNCLTYNLTYDASRNAHRQDGGLPVLSNNFTADPLFNDLANNKYTYTNNWTTMELSPAICAATDGSDLGDPRWHRMGTLPSTDFASAYDLLSTKALLNGRVALNENNHIKYNHSSTTADGTATWRLHVNGTCYVSAVAIREAESTSGCQLTLTVKDADGNILGSPLNAAASYDANDIQFPGTIYFPEAGDYTFVLTNSTLNSSAILDKITLSYIGGNVQAMPGTATVADAWFSSNGTRADGKITFPGSTIQDGWVKWNVSFTDAANYNVTVNIDNTNGHWYTVALYENEDDLSPISVTEGAQKGTIGTLDLGAMTVPAGNYILKVTNATSYSDAKLVSVQFTYAGGAAIDLTKTTPASLLANADAILSSDWSIEDNKIVHPESKALTGWAKWNVDCANDGNYNVTVNIASDNGHLVRVEVFEDENAPAVYTLDEASSTKYTTGDLALDLGNIALDAKEYVFKVSNTVSSSHVQIASIVITYQNGARATLPATFDFADGMLSAKAHITAGELWFNEIGDSNPVGQWAKWNVKVATAGTFLFTMNVNSSNSQSYKISILSGDTEIDAFESGSLGSGEKTVKHYFNLAAGNYTVKLENTYSWSQGHIVSLVVTEPSILVLDEAAETNAVITANYRIDAQDIQITRTIVADMYNTICLPFDVSDAELKAIFGSDVELKQMSSAELNGDELDLIFEDVTTGIYRGTPYLIKTSSNVVNPVFTDAIIKEKVGQATSGTNADFIGSFIKGEVPAGENNLFLGPNDLLYFSATATPIKGMRAWFQLKGISNPQQVIKRAKIVTGNQVVSSIDFVKDADNGSIKVIENGQLIIIKNGIRYNVMGVMIK